MKSTGSSGFHGEAMRGGCGASGLLPLKSAFSDLGAQKFGRRA